MQKSAKRYIHAFYEENKLNYVLTIAATIGVSFVQIGLAGLIKKLMDLASEGTLEQLRQELVMVVLFLLGCAAAFFLLRSVKYNFMRKAVTGYRNLAFREITAHSIGAFNKNNSGNYISALTNDVTSIESNYLLADVGIMEAVLTAVLSLSLMFYYSWESRKSLDRY